MEQENLIKSQKQFLCKCKYLNCHAAVSQLSIGQFTNDIAIGAAESNRCLVTDKIFHLCECLCGK